MAPRKTATAEQTAPEQAETAPAETAKRKHHDYDAVLAGLGGFEEAEPIKRATAKVADLPDDHPLVKAFIKTYQNEKPLKVKAADVAGTQALLRRIANQKGLGVRLEAHDDGVVFQAKPRTTRVRKPKAATA